MILSLGLTYPLNRRPVIRQVDMHQGGCRSIDQAHVHMSRSEPFVGADRADTPHQGIGKHKLCLPLSEEAVNGGLTPSEFPPNGSPQSTNPMSYIS